MSEGTTTQEGGSASETTTEHAKPTVKAVWASETILIGKRKQTVWWHVGVVKNKDEEACLVAAMAAQFGTRYGVRAFTPKEQALHIEHVCGGEYPPDLEGFIQPELPRGQRTVATKGPAEVATGPFAITGVCWRVYIAWPGQKPLWNHSRDWYSSLATDADRKKEGSQSCVADVFPAACRRARTARANCGFDNAPFDWVVILARTPEIASSVAQGLPQGYCKRGEIIAAENTGGVYCLIHPVEEIHDADALMAASEALKRQAAKDAKEAEATAEATAAAHGAANGAAPPPANGNGDMTKADALRKVKALLNLTVARGATAEEEASSQRMAEELMNKYGFRYTAPSA